MVILWQRVDRQRREDDRPGRFCLSQEYVRRGDLVLFGHDDLMTPHPHLVLVIKDDKRLLGLEPLDQLTVEFRDPKRRLGIDSLRKFLGETGREGLRPGDRDLRLEAARIQTLHDGGTSFALASVCREGVGRDPCPIVDFRP